MKNIVFAAALVALAPAFLLADEPDDIYQRLDRDGDGLVSRAEVQAMGSVRLARQFDILDKNKDGFLSQSELRRMREDHFAGKEERFDMQFKAADKDGDGSLSKEEAAVGMPKLAQHFDEVDTNKDGVVSGDEIKAHHMAMHRGLHGEVSGGRAGDQHGEQR